MRCQIAGTNHFLLNQNQENRIGDNMGVELQWSIAIQVDLDNMINVTDNICDLPMALVLIKRI